jgi:Fe2+ transport system protein FeoA
MRLDALRPGQHARVVRVDFPDKVMDLVPPWLPQRLGVIGFVPGQSVYVLQRGWGAHSPLAVLIDQHTLWALRPLEAHCVVVEMTVPTIHTQFSRTETPVMSP